MLSKFQPFITILKKDLENFEKLTFDLDKIWVSKKKSKFFFFIARRQLLKSKPPITFCWRVIAVKNKPLNYTNKLANIGKPPGFSLKKSNFITMQALGKWRLKITFLSLSADARCEKKHYENKSISLNAQIQK